MDVLFIIPLVLVSGSSHTASVYLTLAISYNRYLAICRPFSRRQRLGERWQVALALAAATVLSPLFLPDWFLLRYLPGDWALSLFLTASLAKALLQVLLPFSAIAVLTVLVLKELRSADAEWASSLSTRGRRETSAVTRLLLTVAALFLLCHVPSVMLYVLSVHLFFPRGGAEEAPDLSEAAWLLNLLTASDFFAMLNSSCNFVVYAARDGRFRAALASAFRWKRKQEDRRDSPGQTDAKIPVTSC